MLHTTRGRGNVGAVKAPRTLYTSEAAKMAGITQASFRREASREAARGNDLHAPADLWPDPRTPLWDEVLVRAWLANRPGRGRWASTRA